MKPTLAHNAPKNAGDPDNPDWSEEDFLRARPTQEVMPELVEWYKRTRGKQKSPTKVLVSLRLDRDLVETLRQSGRGWQGRVNEILRRTVLE
jgi:uncharacterized protein (DUF4415 family)